MNIIDHGLWEEYKPDEPPVKNAPPNCAYARRVDDGMDWYVYAHSGENFEPDTVKLLIAESDEGEMVRVPVVEADRLFPAGHRILELVDVRRVQDEKALIKEYANRLFDRRTGRVGELIRSLRPPTEPTITPQQVMAKLEEIAQRLEKLERKKDG